MNETIRLMKSHFSVRRFKDEAIKEEDLNEILTAGQLEKFSVLFCDCGQEQREKRGSLRLASSRSHSSSSGLPSICWRFKSS